MENVELYADIDKVLSGIDFSGVTSESSGYDEVPDGYYLCELEKAELKVSKSSGNPMAALQFVITENGVDIEIDDSGTPVSNEIKHTARRKLFIYYTISDERNVKRFATDMLKFEGEVAGEPILPREAFTTAETLADALDILVGMQIYVQVSTSEKNGESSTWRNLISWKRAAALGLRTW